MSYFLHDDSTYLHPERVPLELRVISSSVLGHMLILHRAGGAGDHWADCSESF